MGHSGHFRRSCSSDSAPRPPKIDSPSILHPLDCSIGQGNLVLLRLPSDSRKNIEQRLANSSCRQTARVQFPCILNPQFGRDVDSNSPWSAHFRRLHRRRGRPLVAWCLGMQETGKAQRSEAGLENNLPFQPTLHLSIELAIPSRLRMPAHPSALSGMCMSLLFGV